MHLILYCFPIGRPPFLRCDWTRRHPSASLGRDYNQPAIMFLGADSGITPPIYLNSPNHCLSNNLVSPSPTCACPYCLRFFSSLRRRLPLMCKIDSLARTPSRNLSLPISWWGTPIRILSMTGSPASSTHRGPRHALLTSAQCTDITLAASKSIDAFVLNVGRDSWEPARVADAFQAVKTCSERGIRFSLLFSFDMTSLPCTQAGDADTLRNYITTYTPQPNYFVYGGKALVSTFAGDSCTFGQGSPDAGWRYAVKNGPQVFFVPGFFNTGSLPAVVDGAFNVRTSSCGCVRPFVTSLTGHTSGMAVGPSATMTSRLIPIGRICQALAASSTWRLCRLGSSL